MHVFYCVFSFICVFPVICVRLDVGVNVHERSSVTMRVNMHVYITKEVGEPAKWFPFIFSVHKQKYALPLLISFP